MVLSEVVERLMMMSGSDASSFPAECGQAAASRLTEVVATTVPAGHRRLGGPSQELSSHDHAAFGWPHSNEVPSTQMQWRMTAIFRAMATFALFIPIRLASFIPQALRDDHFSCDKAKRSRPRGSPHQLRRRPDTQNENDHRPRRGRQRGHDRARRSAAHQGIKKTRNPGARTRRRPHDVSARAPLLSLLPLAQLESRTTVLK